MAPPDPRAILRRYGPPPRGDEDEAGRRGSSRDDDGAPGAVGSGRDLDRRPVEPIPSPASWRRLSWPRWPCPSPGCGPSSTRCLWALARAWRSWLLVELDPAEQRPRLAARRGARRPPPSGRAASSRCATCATSTTGPRPTSPSAGKSADLRPRPRGRPRPVRLVLGPDALRPHHPQLGASRTRRPSRRRSRRARRRESRTRPCSGFFRQFELVYVVADERDVVRLRTNYRGERVFLYRLDDVARGSPRSARAVPRGGRTRWPGEPGLVQRVHRELHDGHLAQRAGHLAPDSPFDWRLLANGYLDQMAYERGLVDTSLPFARAAAAERHHGAREGLRRPGRLLGLYPRGASGTTGPLPAPAKG